VLGSTILAVVYPPSFTWFTTRSVMQVFALCQSKFSYRSVSMESTSLDQWSVECIFQLHFSSI
jgi:hypothetical protein